jgi:hypothetical protein
MLDLKLPDFIPKAFLLRALPKQYHNNSCLANRNRSNQQHSPHVPSGPLLINGLCNLLKTAFILHHCRINVRENVFVRVGTDAGTGVKGFQGN